MHAVGLCGPECKAGARAVLHHNMSTLYTVLHLTAGNIRIPPGMALIFKRISVDQAAVGHSQILAATRGPPGSDVACVGNLHEDACLRGRERFD